MEVAPFFVDFHHFLSIFTIFHRFSRFTHFCRDLYFVAIYALFPQFFFGQNSLLRNITRFLHVCDVDDNIDADAPLGSAGAYTHPNWCSCRQFARRENAQNVRTAHFQMELIFKTVMVTDAGITRPPVRASSIPL